MGSRLASIQVDDVCRNGCCGVGSLRGLTMIDASLFVGEQALLMLGDRIVGTEREDRARRWALDLVRQGKAGYYVLTA